MNPQELYAYLVSLFRSGPELVAAFVVGVVSTILVAYSLRRWVFPERDIKHEIARKDAELARKDGEIARKDAELVRSEYKDMAHINLPNKLNPDTSSVLGRAGFKGLSWKPILRMSRRR